MTTAIQLPIEIEKLDAKSGQLIYLPQDGLTPYFEHIKAQVIGEVPELTTKKGRDRVASLSAQVSRSKTAVEKPGREYLKLLKAQPKLVEAQLKTFVDNCDALRDEVRKPLTEWEAAKKLHTEKLEQRVAFFETAARNVQFELSEVIDAAAFDEQREYVNDVIGEVKETVIDDSFEELKDKAGAAKLFALESLDALLAKINQAETDLIAFKAQQAKEQADREARIAAAAAAQAKADAEAAAQAEIDKANKAAADAIAETEAAKQREAQAAEAAKQREIAAEAAAKQREAQAIETERLRKQQEEFEANQVAQQAADEAKAKSENIEYKRTVNRKAVAQLVEQLNIGELLAVEIVRAAARGELYPLTMDY